MSIIVYFDGLKETIKIDFTTGDVLTPREVSFTYRTVIYGTNIELKAYNIETVLAEKIETILSRGALNTRMRDFYDVHLLWELRKEEIDRNMLKNAFINTSKYRNTHNQIMSDGFAIILSIEQDIQMVKLWETYQNSYSFAKEVSWKDTINSTRSMMNDIMSSSQ